MIIKDCFGFELMLQSLIYKYNQGEYMTKNKKIFLWDENIDKVDLSEYTHIRAYHGCRTSNVESYIKEGIHTFNRKQAYKIVHDTLIQCNIEEKVILKCFNEKWNDNRDHFDKVCVNISKEDMLHLSGHYLVYGSEFICGMAADLFCQYKLKEIGKPTLIECHIDKCKFSWSNLQAIEDNEIKYGCWDGGIYLLDDVSPDEIVEITYPQKIYDPLLRCYYYTK